MSILDNIITCRDIYFLKMANEQIYNNLINKAQSLQDESLEMRNGTENLYNKIYSLKKEIEVRDSKIEAVENCAKREENELVKLQTSFNAASRKSRLVIDIILIPVIFIGLFLLISNSKKRKMYPRIIEKKQAILNETKRRLETLKNDKKEENEIEKSEQKIKAALDKYYEYVELSKIILAESSQYQTNSLAAERAFYKYANSIGIYKDYQDIIPICQFVQYLESGRCNELEGPYGCYNLFEQELKQNIIINELKEVNSNLAKIRKSMEEIYDMLLSIEELAGNMLDCLIEQNKKTNLLVCLNAANLACNQMNQKSLNNIDSVASAIRKEVKQLRH